METVMTRLIYDYWACFGGNTAKPMEAAFVSLHCHSGHLHLGKGPSTMS